MSHDVASHWLLGVNSISHATTRISSHLICYEHCDIELLTDFLQLAHNSVQDLLALGQFTSTRVVNPEWSHDGVHHQKCKLVLDHLPSGLHHQIDETVHCEGPSHKDIVEDLLSIEVESIGNGLDTLRSECVLSVDVQHFALPAALRSWQLRSDTESMT